MHDFNVSVVIPAYNSEHSIEKAVQSVIEQSVPVKEIIIVNDGSSDGTIGVVRKLEKMSDGIRLIEQANGGPAKARNTGIENASCEWIAFLDADDSWLPHRLEMQYEVLKSYPDLKWVSGRYNNCTPTHVSLSKFTYEKKQKPLQSLNALQAMADMTSLWTGTILMKRSALLEIGVFDTELHGCEDFDLWLRFAKKYSTIGFVVTPIANYTVDQAGSLVGIAARQLEPTKLTFYSKVKGYVDSSVSETTKQLLQEILSNLIGKYAFNLTRTGNVTESRKLCKWAVENGMPQIKIRFTWLNWFPAVLVRAARSLYGSSKKK